MSEETTDCPEWATCDRTGCDKPATHGYKATLFGVKVCSKHLPKGAKDVQVLEVRWWEEVPLEIK